MLSTDLLSVGYSVGYYVGFSVGGSTTSRNDPAIGVWKERMGRLSRLSRHKSRFCSRFRRFVRDRRGDMGFGLVAGKSQSRLCCWSMPSSVTRTEAPRVRHLVWEQWNS